MEHEKNLHGIASSTIDIIGSKRGIGFSASVNQAKALSDIFNRHRSGMSAWVCGKTDKEERKKIIADFGKGKIQWLWNCGVFTEGFDDSGVEVISMARPTKSRSLYAQMAGRSTRPHESIAHKLNDCPANALRRAMIARSCKPSALLIDFVGNSGKHKLITSADILGGNYSDEAIEQAVAMARKSGGRVRMDRSIEEEEKRLEEKKARELEEQARKAKLVAKSFYKTQSIDPFDVFQIKPSQPRGWDAGKEISPKMAKMLRENLGIDPSTIPYTQALQLVREQLRRWDEKLCTFKQAKKLKEFGIDASKFNFQQADQAFKYLNTVKWRKYGNENFKPVSSVQIPKRRDKIVEDLVDNVPF